jgi:hypothetical protein
MKRYPASRSSASSRQRASCGMPFRFFRIGKFGSDRKVRLARIDGLGSDQLDLLRRLDLALWAISGPIDVTILRYLEAHKDEVLAAEQC